MNKTIMELENIAHHYTEKLSCEEEKEACHEQWVARDQAETLSAKIKHLEYRQEEGIAVGEKRPRISQTVLEEPPLLPPDFSPRKVIAGHVLKVITLVSAIFWVLGLLFGSFSSFFETVGLICFIPLTLALIDCFSLKTMSNSSTYLKYREKLDPWKKPINEALCKEQMDHFFNAYLAFDQAFLAYAEACKKNAECTHQELSAQLESISEEMIAQLADCQARLAEHENALAEVTLLTPDLFPLAYDIALNLKNHRADSLKEAINLTIDESRKEREEAERRVEAARREEILFRQAEDNRLHQQEMERMAQAEAKERADHNRAMEREAARQNQILQDNARKQETAAQQRAWSEERAQRDAISRQKHTCQRCKNYLRCPNAGHVSNCGAFVPKN